MYPDRDYCLLTLPHTAPENSLLQWFNYVDPTPRNTFAHVLYLVHRDSIEAWGQLSLRTPEQYDRQDLLTLTSHLSYSQQLVDAILDETSENKEKKKLQCMIVECFSTPVGLITYTRMSKNELEVLRSEFAIEDFIVVDGSVEQYASHFLTLHDFLINPLFNRQISLLFADFFKATQAQYIDWRVFRQLSEEGDGVDFRGPSSMLIPQLLRYFVQVRPRKKPILSNRPNTHALEYDKKNKQYKDGGSGGMEQKAWTKL